MDENTPFNQTPDCIRFDTLNHIEEDYQITTRNLSKMALNGKIKFYGQPPSSWCLEGFVLPIDTPVDYKNTMRPPDDNGLICFTQKEITTFYYTGQIKLIRAVLARERNIISQSHGYNIHTKNMIIIDTQELEQALALTKSGPLPPLLALANQCWIEIFGQAISYKFVGLKISDMIEEKVEKKIADIGLKLNIGQTKELKKIITPSDFRGFKILKPYSDCSENNKKDDHTFYAEGLATANEKWDKFMLLPVIDQRKKELVKILKPIADDKGKSTSYYNRIYNILTYDVDFSSFS